MTSKNPFDDEADDKKAAPKPADKSLKLDDKPKPAAKAAETKSAAETAPNPPSADDVTAEEIRKTEAAAAAKATPKPKTKRQAKAAEKKQADFNKAVSDKGVLSASSGQVTATIDMNQVAVPVLRVSMIGWVGTAPLELTADSISDIRKVLDELEKQAS